LLREIATGKLPAIIPNSRKTVPIAGRDCYSKLLRDLPRRMFRRGQKPYYRHTIPVDAQPLLKRVEIWRSLRTDSFAVASRRLPSVIARIEMEIEHARAMVGLPVDLNLLPSSPDDPANFTNQAEPSSARVQTDSPLTLSLAYRNYIGDPTRAWMAKTREAYETSRRLAVAIIGEAVAIASISRAHCREMLDVLRFLPSNAGELFPKLSPRAAAEPARLRCNIKIISAANANSLMSNKQFPASNRAIGRLGSDDLYDRTDFRRSSLRMRGISRRHRGKRRPTRSTSCRATSRNFAGRRRGSERLIESCGNEAEMRQDRQERDNGELP